MFKHIHTVQVDPNIGHNGSSSITKSHGLDVLADAFEFLSSTVVAEHSLERVRSPQKCSGIL